MYSLEQHVVSVLLCKEKVLPDLEDVVPNRVREGVSCDFHNHLVNKRTRDILHEKVVGVPTNQVDVEDESERAGHEDLVLMRDPVCFGTETYRVSPGLASLRSKVMRLTVRSAFVAPSVFSVCADAKFLAQTSCIDSRNHVFNWREKNENNISQWLRVASTTQL